MSTNGHESSRPASYGEMVLYQIRDGAVKVECVFAGENLWLTQEALAELFGVEVPAISKHLANTYESGELDPSATLSKMETVRQEGNRE